MVKLTKIDFAASLLQGNLAAASLSPERQGAAACQAPPPEPAPPPAFTSSDSTTSALLSTPSASLGVPPSLPGQSSPAPAPSGAPSDKDDLPLPVRDAIVSAQWSELNTDPLAPLGLSAAALVAAAVCDAARDADAVIKALAKAGVLARGSHEPVTTKIGARLTHQVKVLSVPAAKVLARVLFFWEEEVMRLRRYAGEQADLEVALGRLRAERAKLETDAAANAIAVVGGGDAAQDEAAVAAAAEELKEERERLEKMANEVEFRIKAIELRKRVQPSKRESEIDLPRYEPAASL